MSVETATAPADISNAPVISEDDQLGAIFDQIENGEGQQEENIQPRGEDGKFASPKGADGTAQDDGDTGSSLEGEGGEADDGAVSTPAIPNVPLPANWRGMDEVWAKIPEDVREQIADHQAKLQQTFSRQGNQLNALRPMSDVLDRNKELFEGKVLPDGQQATPAGAVELLFGAHRKISQNPVAGLLEVADMYGARQALAHALGVQAAPNSSAGVSPAEIKALIRDAMSEVSTRQATEAEELDRINAAEKELDRLSKGKPLYSEIAEDDMVYAINKARGRLGEAASIDAVFDLAYDMAVNADPDLRKKAAAVQKKPAAEDPKKIEGAKRASSVNLTSTSTGKARELSEDELLAKAFDEAQDK